MIKENIHLGVVLPASNLTIESEFYNFLSLSKELSKRVFFHFARAGFYTRYKVSGEAYLSEVAKDTPEEVRKLSKIRQLKDIVFCCTSGSLYLNDNIKQEIKSYFPKGVITPVECLIESMKKVNISNILLVTPYSNEISSELRESLQANDILPKKVISLNLTTSSELLEYSKEKLFTLIDDELTKDSDYDGVCIMCTNFPTFHLIKDLENKINKPVVSSNLSVIFNLLNRSKIEFDIPEAGILFTKGRK